MENWIAEHYFNSKLKIPDPILQTLIHTWVRISHWLDEFRSSYQSKKEISRQPIAEKSQELMEAHYEMPRELFQSFLGPTMKYSMGFWEKGARDLEEAQIAMMRNLCRKAKIQDGDTILDIGCGFGSFAEFVLREFPNCTVHGLNLSEVHCQYLKEKQFERGHPFHSGRFNLIASDFNDFDTDLQFDRVVSIGFFEHVSNLGEALRKISCLLNQNGIAFLHYIVCREDPDLKASSNGFLNTYIFPGATIHPYYKIFTNQRDMQIDAHWYLNGSNYRKTIESWLKNFRQNYDLIAQETGLDPQWLKMWELYFQGCIAVFSMKRGNYYGNGQYRLVKR